MVQPWAMGLTALQVVLFMRVDGKTGNFLGTETYDFVLENRWSTSKTTSTAIQLPTRSHLSHLPQNIAEKENNHFVSNKL